MILLGLFRTVGSSIKTIRLRWSGTRLFPQFTTLREFHLDGK